MKPQVLYFALLALAAGQTDAATWTGSDSFALAAGSARMSVTFTGDGIANAAEVEIWVPRGFGIVSTTGRNGGMCARVTGTSIVRVIALNPMFTPLPSVPLNQCDIRLSVPTRGGSYPFPMANAGCYDTGGNPMLPCTVDPGSIFVINPI